MNASSEYRTISSSGYGAVQGLQADTVMRAARGDGQTGLKLRDLAPAVTLLVIGVAALLAATLSPSGTNGQYLVIAPSWYRLGETIALIQKVDGGIAEMGGPANIVVAYSEDPDFVRKVYAAGAWLVLDPLKLRGCAGLGLETR